MDNPLVQLDPGLFIWTILTFLLLFGVLAKFAWKPLLQYLEGREETIRKSLDDAEKAKEELERLTSEGDAIVAKARSEAQSIVTEGKNASQKIKDDTIREAKEQASKLLDKAKDDIRTEKDKAISEIKNDNVKAPEVINCAPRSPTIRPNKPEMMDAIRGKKMQAVYTL